MLGWGPSFCPGAPALLGTKLEASVAATSPSPAAYPTLPGDFQSAMRGMCWAILTLAQGGSCTNIFHTSLVFASKTRSKINSQPANSSEAVYCLDLAQQAARSATLGITPSKALDAFQGRLQLWGIRSYRGSFLGIAKRLVQNAKRRQAHRCKAGSK